MPSTMSTAARMNTQGNPRATRENASLLMASVWMPAASPRAVWLVPRPRRKTLEGLDARRQGAPRRGLDQVGQQGIAERPRGMRGRHVAPVRQRDRTLHARL